MYSIRKLLPMVALCPLGEAQVAVYGQCGGSGYSGSTVCVSGAVCSTANAYYYQCVPGTATASATVTSTTLVSAVTTSSTSTSKATTATSAAVTSKTSSTSSPESSSSAGTKYLIVFGDSYSTTGSWIGSDKPSASNPIGNPPLPGTTTDGGLNWVGQTVSKLNTSLVLAYDFAVSGAVTDSAIVDGYATYNFDDQVDLFQTYLAGKPDYAPWTSTDTLVAVWFGINDVGESFWDYETTPISAVMDRYFGLLQTLFDDGVRNFALLTIPPFDQAPVMIGQTTDRLNDLRSNITAYNTALGTRLATFKAANSGVTAQVFNTTPSFQKVFNSPTSYGASSDLTCYNSDGTTCVWWDNYHPGQAIQSLVGQAFVSTFTGTFF